MKKHYFTKVFTKQGISIYNFNRENLAKNFARAASVAEEVETCKVYEIDEADKPKEIYGLSSGYEK